MSWKIALASGQFLDLPPGFSLSFELNNTMFSSSNSDVLPGSYTFPADLALTPTNKRLLDNPHLVTNASAWKKYEGVWVYAHDAPVFWGTLTIRGADERRVRCNIVANPVSALKKIPLNQLDLGGIRTIGNTSAWLAHAKDTAQNPLNYDYVFCPVYNDEFFNTPTSDARCRLQNHYNVNTQAFEVGQDYPAFTPFPRLEYLLSRCFSNTEYQFTNAFQRDNELKKLITYTNKSLWTAVGLPSAFDMRFFVSNTNTTDWLRKVMSTFQLSLFVNPWNKTIKLATTERVWRDQNITDWSAYLISQPALEDTSEVPDTFNFREDSTDGASDYMKNRYPRPLDSEVLGTFNTIEAVADDPVASFVSGIYYITSREAYYYYSSAASPPNNFSLRYSELGPYPIRDTDLQSFDALMPPLYDYWHQSDALLNRPSTMPVGVMPLCRITGDVEYTPTGGSTTRQQQQVPDRLMLYRGMYQDIDLNTYPQASSTPWLNLGVKFFNYSLRMQGDDGLYNKFHYAWHNQLKYGKHAVLQFALPVDALINFSFEMKIRVINMNYLAKKIKVSRLLSGGKILIEVSGVTTV